MGTLKPSTGSPQIAVKRDQHELKRALPEPDRLECPKHFQRHAAGPPRNTVGTSASFSIGCWILSVDHRSAFEADVARMEAEVRSGAGRMRALERLLVETEEKEEEEPPRKLPATADVPVRGLLLPARHERKSRALRVGAAPTVARRALGRAWGREQHLAVH